jgi:hypothetical protein
MKCVWNDLKPWGVFIGWGGRNLKFLEKKSDFFEPYRSKTASFQFTWLNLNLNQLIWTRHVTTTRWLQAVVRAVPPAPARRYAYCSLRLPRRRQQAVAPGVLALPPVTNLNDLQRLER